MGATTSQAQDRRHKQHTRKAKAEQAGRQTSKQARCRGLQNAKTWVKDGTASFTYAYAAPLTEDVPCTTAIPGHRLSKQGYTFSLSPTNRTTSLDNKGAWALREPIHHAARNDLAAAPYWASDAGQPRTRPSSSSKQKVGAQEFEKLPPGVLLLFHGCTPRHVCMPSGTSSKEQNCKLNLQEIQLLFKNPLPLLQKSWHQGSCL